jgi:hypothetical protein
MSLRHGVTAQEEHKLKALIAKGKSWAEIVEAGHLEDVDVVHVKREVFDPLVKRHEVAVKAGHKSVIDHERAIAKKKAEEKKAAKDEE